MASGYVDYDKLWKLLKAKGIKIKRNLFLWLIFLRTFWQNLIKVNSFGWIVFKRYVLL